MRNLDRYQREKLAEFPGVLEGEPTVEEFRFLAYDEGGMTIGPTGAHRLVCVTDTGAKVVIFGRESELDNINAIVQKGLPCIVRCETHPTSQTANRMFGHTHWVWENSKLEVVTSRLVEEVLEP